ncbi:hypothetical protein D2E26_1214 [Bifidobacterium dolichotidis]|uniref:DUF4244 domain-containing protein n=1 Tax=Bifidobacterium dolichotidis TaxID=2306976 RepID=A0A430FQR1_9BIFI|nr:DUF4244 domain-containing protein [Bifidobacterium dolichotidis]RSX55160.1 hypothetical protein D2E26_1214 [Bifidobacterium dolichotidis]
MAFNRSSTQQFNRLLDGHDLDQHWPLSFRLSMRSRRWLEALQPRGVFLDDDPERGAATAEYAVVLVAATGFAALLVALLKSGTVQSLLEGIVQRALSIG